MFGMSTVSNPGSRQGLGRLESGLCASITGFDNVETGRVWNGLVEGRDAY